jgi:hypothetical protein
MARQKRTRAANQDDKDVRVFTFKLDRRNEQEALAREALEEMEENKDWTLRKQIVHWLTVDEQQLVVYQQSDVSAEIQEAFADFRADFFMEVLGVLRDTNPDMLRNFADRTESDTSETLDPKFVSGMLKGFKR